MGNIISYRIKRIIVKLRISLRSNIHYERGLTPPQKLAIDIVFKLLKNKNSILLVSPISGERHLQLYDELLYGRNQPPETYVTINGDRITIVNHKYYYDLEMTRSMFLKLSEEFDKETERRRRKMKKEIMDNIVDSLIDINNRI